MCGKKIAVIVFIPNNPKYIQQFFGLYYSVMIHPKLRATIDFIIGCEPGIEKQFDLNNSIVIHTREISQEENYQFRLMNNKPYNYINSWSHFISENGISKILEYPYALRIDLDTFISPNILNIEINSNDVLTGNGGYIGGQTTKDNLLRVANTLNMKHRGIHNIGSTWYTTSNNMISIGQASLRCAEYLLENEFSEKGEWPIWWANVTTLYAGEIALNHSGLNIILTNKLDTHSTTEKNINDVYTVHCWHSEQFFSKHQYIQRKYDKMSTPMNIETCKNYAFFFTRLSGIINTNDRDILPSSITPGHAIRIAFYLLKQAIPYLPKLILIKIMHILGILPHNPRV